MRNAEIAAHFDELGDLYELDGAVVSRVGGYRNAAKAIREAPVSVEELARQGKVTSLSGVGKTIAEKIDALLETGQIPSAVKLKAKYPPGLVEITRIPGLGPKKARKLFDTLGVDSLDALKAAIEQERVRDVPGFGKKTEETIAHAIASGETAPAARVLHSQAARIAESLGGGAARAPRVRAGRGRRVAAALGRHKQGHRHRRYCRECPRAGRRVRGAAA